MKKLLLIGICILLFASFVSAWYTPIIYYEAEQTQTDSASSHISFTLNTTRDDNYPISYTNGKVGNYAFRLNSTSNTEGECLINNSGAIGTITSTIKTIDFWFYANASQTVGADAIFFYLGGGSDGGTDRLMTYVEEGSGRLYAYYDIGSVNKFGSAFGSILEREVWHHLVMIINTSGYHIHIDGSVIANFTSADTTPLDADFHSINLGCMRKGFSYFNGSIDNVALFSDEYSMQDLTDSYNSGAGLNFIVTAGIPATPIIESPSPVDNSNNNTGAILNVSHPTTLNDVRYYLYFGDTLPLTEANSLYLNNVTRTAEEYANFTTNVSDGTYYWKFQVQNVTDGQFSANTTQRTWTLDTTLPTISFGANNNFSLDNSTIISSFLNNLSINISFFDINLYQTLINITNSSDGSLYSKLNTSITLTNVNVSEVINLTGWAIGNYTIKLVATDSHTATKIDDYSVRNGINTITFNTVEGYEIKISSDGSAYSTLYNRKIDRYEFGWNYLLTDTTRKFTVEADSKISYLPNSEFIGHFVVANNGKGNWIDFEGIGKDYSVKKINDYKYEITFTNIPLTNTIISKSIGGLNTKEEHYLLRLGAVIDVWAFDEENYPKQVNATAIIGVQSANSSINLSGARLINITQEITELTLTSSGFGTEIETFAITQIYHNLSFNMTPTLATKLYFYDEKSEELIEGETFAVYLETTGFSNTYSATLNPYIITGLTQGLYKLKASSTNYLERQYLNLNITNTSTTILNLYLTNITLGSEVTFNIVGEALNPLESVSVVFTKIINGTKTVIAQENSDYAGQVVIDLDSNTEYVINFSKEDYEDKTISLEPKNSEYIITMVSTVGAYNMSVHEGIRYNFEPSNMILNNNTKYNFTFTLNSTVWEVTGCNLYLWNGTTNLLDSTSGYTSSGCHLRIEQDTFTMTNITSEAVYQLGSAYNFTVSEQYAVIYTYQGEFSLMSFLDELTDFNMAGFDNFGRMILAFIVIFGVLAGISIKTGFENKEILLFVLWGLVGFFSFIGWFYLDLGTMPNFLGIRKWFIFYLVTLIVIAFVVDKVRK